MTDGVSIDDFVFVPIETATNPDTGLAFVYRDYWWAVDQHGRIAFYNPLVRNPRRPGRRIHPGLGFPQCNPRREVAEKVSGERAWFREVRQIPLVIVESHPCEWSG